MEKIIEKIPADLRPESSYNTVEKSEERMLKIRIPKKMGVVLFVAMMFCVTTTFAVENLINDGGVGLLQVDPEKEDTANGIEPKENASGKISQLSKDSLTISGKDYVIVPTTLFNDSKGDSLAKEAFTVGDGVTIIFKQYTLQLIEIRETEGLTAMDDVKQEDTSKKQGDQRKDAIRLKNGVYVN
ncbi:MAG: hypothetical protein Q8R88_02835 [Desulfoprunum sp.]|nr:hypothetical protein [Desulfoprunum sp.]